MTEPIEPLAKDAQIVHCVERHAPGDAGTVARETRAESSWQPLYEEGLFKPCPVHEYPRTSAELGDDRNLPYLKDVLVEGMTAAVPFSALVNVAKSHPARRVADEICV